MSFKIPSHVTWKDLDSGLILLDLQTSCYYTLNETASSLWRALMKKKSEQEILRSIQDEFDCLESQAKADIREQIEFLLKEGLIANN
ncbi:MAG: PqqD family protein [Candidatus Aureabacteria bacterium]|nr:PqqD family protein [Candidatus Auribacterota bacterium]